MSHAIWKFGPNFNEQPVVLNDFDLPGTVTTEQLLMAFTKLGHQWGDLIFSVRNDGSTLAYATVNQSPDGTVPIEEEVTKMVPVGQSVQFVFRDVLTLFWSLSASGDPDAAFAAAQVSWELVARRRYRAM